MQAISIQNLTKKYKDRLAVDNLSVDIKQGEFFALLGFNGAGKTTTIKMLSGLLKPTSGDAFILGKSIVHEMDDIKQDLNISPQETAVAPNLSVFDNLVFIAEVYGFNKSESQRLRRCSKAHSNVLICFWLAKTTARSRRKRPNPFSPPAFLRSR